MQIRYSSQSSDPTFSSKSKDLGTLNFTCLGPNAVERLPLQLGNYQQKAAFHTWKDRQLTLGFANIPFTEKTFLDTSRYAYDQLFKATRNQYLFRIWNYIPEINAGNDDNERYRQFCISRSESFRHFFGENEIFHMPAGTCVGIPGDSLVILFLAADTRPDHHENPNQTPAYRYPRQYGPQAPSFARASTGEINGQHYRYISGTAAVRGHESKAIGDLAQQVEITCDNLDNIAAQTLAGTSYKESQQSLLCGKVYLRRANDYEETKTIIEKRYPKIADQFIYLESDICRKELLVEIEFSFIDPLIKNRSPRG